MGRNVHKSLSVKPNILMQLFRDATYELLLLLPSPVQHAVGPREQPVFMKSLRQCSGGLV